MTMPKKRTTPKSPSPEGLLGDLASLAETLVPRDRQLVESARGWIAWAYRENGRLVRERDRMTKDLDSALAEIKRCLIALGGTEDRPVAVLRPDEFLADGVLRKIRELADLREREQRLDRTRIFG